MADRDPVDAARELFAQLSASPRSTEVLVEFLDLSAGAVDRGGGALRHAAREIAGEVDHSEAGRPHIDDTIALERIRKLLALGYTMAGALRSVAASLAQGRGSRFERVIVRRLRGKLLTNVDGNTI